MDLKVKPIENDTEENRMLNSLYLSPMRKRFVEVGDEKLILPDYFDERWNLVNKLEVRNDDVFVTGHPRSGTTWLNEIVNLIVYGMDENGTSRGAHSFLDFMLVFDKKVLDKHCPNFHKDLEVRMQQSSRTIKTHCPWYLLPEQIRNGTKTPKIIHIIRNPKDVCVSLYHFNRSVHGFMGTFQEFCRLFLAGKYVFGPYFTIVKSYWEKRNCSNLLILTYSELKKDTFNAVKKIGQFLGKCLTDEDVLNVIKQSSPESIKATVGKEMENHFDSMTACFESRIAKLDFVRCAKEGDYQSVMSEELIKEFDRVTNAALEGTGLSFE